MRVRTILYIIGGLLCALGMSMLLPAVASLWYKDSGLWPLAASIAVTLCSGGILLWTFRGSLSRDAPLTHREGMATVAFAWIIACFFGALPYAFAGILDITDAVFESVSGFTTTGSSVLSDVEAVAPGLLLWRATTHWLGGMGIIVLSLAILPYLGMGGMQLYKAEVPGPSPDKLTPRLKDTAAILWEVYLLLTLLQILCLLPGEMTLFEAICHTFASVATGGFSTRNASLGAYGAYSQWVCIVFMFLAGANFVLHFKLLRGECAVYKRDGEFCFYAAFVGLAVLIVFLQRLGHETGIENALRTAAFQVVSIVTTTGFVNADFETWAPLSQLILLLLMFAGGCAGSTSGGVKCMRILLLGKQLYHEVFSLVHPHAVHHVKLNRRTVPGTVIIGCFSFVALFLLLWLLSSLVLAALGLDAVTACTAALTCLANTGPGLGTVGPMENFAHLPYTAKWVLSVDMLLGRLELFTLFILCVPEFWRR